MGLGAVIFDFNGVLVDDESLHFALFRDVLALEGVRMTEHDYHERYLGYDDRRCFEEALRDAGQSTPPARLDSLVERKAVRYVAEAGRGLRFFPGAAEALEQAAARWPVAICSGALRAEIQYGLQRLGRLDHVTAIISAEDADKCKPDPQGYLMALEALRARGRASDARALPLAAADCLVIEDSLAGIISAKGAGMRTVGVTNTYQGPELLDAGADAVIEGLATFTPDWISAHFGA